MFELSRCVRSRLRTSEESLELLLSATVGKWSSEMHKKSYLLGLMMSRKEERSNDDAIIGEYSRDTERTNGSINQRPHDFHERGYDFHFWNFIHSSIYLACMGERMMADVQYGVTYSALTYCASEWVIWCCLIEAKSEICVFASETVPKWSALIRCHSLVIDFPPGSHRLVWQSQSRTIVMW